MTTAQASSLRRGRSGDAGLVRDARLIESHFIAPHTKHFHFRVDGPEPFHFQPGQHIHLIASVGAKEMKRPYSIASPPRADNSLDLCLNLVDKVHLTQFLFDMKPGAHVQIKGPSGGFVLRPDARDILFVATGTGIAPLRSMIHHLLAGGAAQRATLLFGVRYEDSILYREEFDQLAAQHANFQFIPTLSRPGEHWTGATGYVQEHVLRLLGGQTDADVYICGLRTMVDEVGGLLQKNRYDERRICYEKYD